MQVMVTDRIDILLTEYKTCQDSIKHQDSRAWTIGGLLLAGSIFGLFKIGVEEYEPLLSIFLSIIAIYLLWSWFRIYRRWGSFVEVAQYRMQEIEKETGYVMRKNLYIDYMDSQNGHNIDETVISDFKNVKSKMGARFSRTSVHKIVKEILICLTLAWSALIIQNIYYIFQ